MSDAAILQANDYSRNSYSIAGSLSAAVLS